MVVYSKHTFVPYSLFTRGAMCNHYCQVEGAADSLSSASAHHAATAALTESGNMGNIGADSPLSMWVFKLSKRLHIGKINSIRGTRGDFFFPVFICAVTKLSEAHLE